MPYLPWINDLALEESVLFIQQTIVRAVDEQAGTLEAFQRNIIDPFEVLFATQLLGQSVEQWLAHEIYRQIQKSIANAIGEFHPRILGACAGWEYLGVGHSSGLDLKRHDDSACAEVKNKFNTMNDSASQTTWAKLRSALDAYPETTAYLVQMIPRGGLSYDRPWHFKGEKNPRIRIISGDVFYALVTGEAEALKELYDLLPIFMQATTIERLFKLNRPVQGLIQALEGQLGRFDDEAFLSYLFHGAYRQFG